MYDCGDCKNVNKGKLSPADLRLVALVNRLTELTQEDVALLLEVNHCLPFISALEDADVYIDILAKGSRLAVVVAQHSPQEGNFYGKSLIGEAMLRKNEPGVYRTLEIGVPSRELKAIVSDAGILVRQSASPILNPNNEVVGVLICEKNIRNQSFTGLGDPDSEAPEAGAQQSEKKEQNIAEYMEDAILLFNPQGSCVYANPQAEHLFRELGYQDRLVGLAFESLSFGNYRFEALVRERGKNHNEIKMGGYNLKVSCNTFWEADCLKGAILVIKDNTEIKKKETELILKSTVIDEIHHRIKNNLQTIVSLIGLQSNRMDNEQVRIFSRDIISRIYSISLTHEIMAYSGVESVEIKDMLSRMLNSAKSYIIPEELDLKLEITGDEIFLESDTATTIAMIINELAQNSIKHAFADRKQGCIHIHIKKGTFFSSITITDDGIGFLETDKDNKMGLKLVRSLVKDKLKGDIEISTQGSGARIAITFTPNEGLTTKY